VIYSFLTGYIKEAAEGGDPFAQFELGWAFDIAVDGEQDFDKAAALYAKAASQGHTAAESNLLLQHVLGQASALPPETVFKRLLELAKLGDTDARVNTGLCYDKGFGVQRDYREAAAWFLRAAEAGSAAAQFNLGGAFYEGKGFDKDFNRAAEWYTKAAQQRHELALIKLGHMYQKAIGVEMDLRRALILYSIAYRQGSVRAANHLGFLFRRGLGVDKDDAIAYKMFLESVSRPDTEDVDAGLSYRGYAYYMLGTMAERGDGVEKDLRAAKDWFKRGAACGRQSCVEAVARIRPKSRPRHSLGTPH